MVPAWMTIVVIAREFAISGLRSIAAAEGYIIQASDFGKAKLVSQVCAISLLMLSMRWLELAACRNRSDVGRRYSHGRFRASVLPQVLAQGRRQGEAPPPPGTDPRAGARSAGPHGTARYRGGFSFGRMFRMTTSSCSFLAEGQSRRHFSHHHEIARRRTSQAYGRSENTTRRHR